MKRVRQLGPYSLLYRVASGGMAEIYRAKIWSLGGEKEVAIKRLLPVYNHDDEFIVMLTDEARITSLFDHPNIARVYEFGVVGGQHFLAMEFIDGVDLRRVNRRLLEREERLGGIAATFIVEQALRGLHAAHEQCDENGRAQNIIHRDFTPSNIQIGYDGAVKLIDFGIAKAQLSRSRTQAGFIKGKVKYMSPEQTRSELLDRRSDVFSAGVVLYLESTGRLPFDADDDEELIDLVRHGAYVAPSLLNAELDDGFDDIVERALAKDRDERYSSALEFAKALERWRDANAAYGVRDLGADVGRLFAQERLDDTRLFNSFVFDDDPTPTVERQSYTRLVGLNSGGPTEITGVDIALEEEIGTKPGVPLDTTPVTDDAE